ncbi:MAG TPA: type 2 isopentenyl-diphosphate Delta-isomerase [Planctomycetota bacterium]|nr:type 2 isopentenyl-diphosphate Delta-isomerase [Planctomycetota bacterium]
MAAAPQFIRLEPAVRVSVHGPAGGPPAERKERWELVATGIHPEGLLLEGGAAGPREGAEVLASLDLAGEPLAATAKVERGPGGAVVLRFTALDEAARARLETFITRNRKSEHIRIVRDEDTAAEGVTTGLERWRLPHEALPELDMREVDLATTVLGRRLEAPILISCMTGGSELAKTVNRRLAKAAQAYGLALGLGSQRAMLKAPELADTYAVRDLAPDVLLIGNLGAVQLNHGVTAADCERLAKAVGADALALHLNPLQEAVQPEGDVDFSGLKAKVAAVAESIATPIVLKEVGNGIGRSLARWVRSTKIAAVDVAGAGGTSWAKVESYRAHDEQFRRLARSFAGWGVPTAASLRACRAELPDRPVFASGGIRDGIEAAKAIALGADLVGLARPFLDAAAKSEEAVLEAARLVTDQLRVAMFCCGAANLTELRKVRLEHEHDDDDHAP